MADFTHTRVAVDDTPKPEPEKPPTAQWPFGRLYTVAVRRHDGSIGQYELAAALPEHARQAVIKAETEDSGKPQCVLAAIK